MNRKILIIAVIIAAAVILVYSLKGEIAESRFKGKAQRLEEKIPEEYREAYSKEFDYVVDKFWDAYRSGIVSENDLIDVAGYIDDLNGKEELTRKEIFDFMDYVSKIYAKEIQRKQEQEYRKGTG